MDRLKLSRIDEELVSSEVAALCFLCHDVVNRKRLEGIGDAKGLFLKLEEKGLLDNNVFLFQLLHTIRRADLLSLLETDSRRPEETDANPILSNFRVMLYQIYEDMTMENFKKMTFLLSDKLGRRQIEACNTALDVFVEMEKIGLLSSTNVCDLHAVLQQLDQQLAATVHHYMQDVTQPRQPRSSHVSMDYQRVNITPQPTQPTLSISETQPNFEGQNVYCDAEPHIESSSLPDQSEYYALTHNPRGVCMVLNNEEFPGTQLKKRGGTEVDEETLRQVFSKLGFAVVVHKNLTADAMRHEVKQLGKRCFSDEDALVVCVLSHGEKGCVFGADEKEVSLQELTRPFTSGSAPTLAGKPKLFFIQACQGSSYQKGSVPSPPTPGPEENRENRMEEDAGRVHGDTVPWDADFLLGMATVPDCKSFRNTSTGSIYIQELCTQLMKSAKSSENDDILSVLTRVNREVSKREYSNHKQMPEPKYTLTKKLVLKCV
ncbi:caspase-8 [Pempheris klunzingeri]|uniref:caspase-8 n=1 Tax=Pempheris klunzingeri TaxID=3127111 RepID=UPI00398107CC